MAVTLSLFAGAGAQFLDNNGNPLSGGKIYTYQAGTTTPLITYTTNSGNTAHTNPIILDAAGRVPSGGEIWLQLGVGYKFIVKTSAEVLIATYDNIPSSAQPPAANDADSIMYEQGYTVTAGSFVIGKMYRIASAGTTDFTLIGAVNNVVGTHFIATGVGTGTGTAELSQTVETKLQETVSVKDFGAVGDGVTDDTVAIQAAVNFACTTGTNVRRALYFPAGIYNISANIKFPLTGLGLTASQKILIFGDSKWNSGSVIRATSASVTRMFEFANVAEAATNGDIGMTFENICLNGANLSTFGVWGAAIAHFSFVRTFITGFTTAGVSIGGTASAGYCNEFTDAVFYANEIGLQLTFAGGVDVAPNQNLFSHTKFWANGIGVDISVGKANKFVNCLFESNTKTAVRAVTGALSLDTCYFENNATTGLVMTTPSFTMKADVYIKGGSSNTALEIFAPSENIEINNCFTQVGDSANGCFVYVAAATNLRLINNNCKDNVQIPLLRTRFNNSYSFLRRVVSENNLNFSTELDLQSYTNTVLLAAARTLNWYKNDRATPRNYSNIDFNTWTFDSSAGGNGGTWARSADKYQGTLPVWNLAWGATSLTYFPRFTLAAADYPELQGKTVAFALAMKASASGGLVTFTTTDFSAQASIPTAWEFRTSIFTFPSSGTVTVGFAFVNLNGNVSVASPMLFEVGADAEMLAGQIESQRQFYGSAVPTAGTWLRGDVVWKSSPSAGSEPGWMCVTAGTPGTWKAMANLAV